MLCPTHENLIQHLISLKTNTAADTFIRDEISQSIKKINECEPSRLPSPSPSRYTVAQYGCFDLCFEDTLEARLEARPSNIDFLHFQLRLLWRIGHMDGPQHVLIGQKIARRILGDPGSRACGSSTCGNLGLSFIGLNFFRRSLAFGIIQIGSSGCLCFYCVYGEHDGRSCQLQECYLLYQDLPAPGISRELISQEAH